MKKMNISDIVNVVATRKCALFAGAGLTADSGGSTWNELVNSIKNELGYRSPLTDNFQIMGDMCNKFGREKVYELVKNRLKRAKIEHPISKLTELPWFTVFTTNYDLALEDSLHKSQPFTIRTIVTGQEFALTGLQSEILCVKLMGSLDKPYNERGSMVLDSGDLANAREERARIFNILESHAANISFLFVGYSFNDNLFFEMLDKLRGNIGTPKHTYYAIFKKAPDEKNTYLLEQYGIEWIVSDLASFAEALSKEVALLDPGNLTLKRIPVGNDVIPISSTKVANFLSFYNPVLLENLGDEIPPGMFFKGNTDSFKPFEDNWHFQRKEIKEVVDTVLTKKKGDWSSSIVKVEGRPGTGRTFVILAAVYELIKKHRAIAIKIPSYSVNPIPSPEELTEFIEEVEIASKEKGIKKPERLVFWAEFALDSAYISRFMSLSFECKYPASLIFEDFTPSEISQIVNQLLTKDTVNHKSREVSIKVDVNLSNEEKKDLAKYLLNTVRKHRFPQIEEYEIAKILSEEEDFLPIMYRTLDPTRRSIHRIVQEEFTSIKDPDVKTCISICALAKSLDLEIPIAVLRKVLSEQIKKSLSYPDTFEIATEKANVFIRESIDSHSNSFVSIYHHLIAKIIVQQLGESMMDKYLVSIANTVDLRSGIEADFISNLFIGKGVHGVSFNFRPFTEKGLYEALYNLKCRQPARLIIHHLARLKANKDVFDEDIIPLLQEALAEPIELYALFERKQNVLVTLAKIKWEQNKERLLSKPRDDPEIQEIIDLLIEAREKVFKNTHAYDVHARILKELWQHKDEDKKMDLINEAVEVINEGLYSCVYDPTGQERLNDILIQSLSEVNTEKAESIAKELLDRKKDGAGYYTLARIEYHTNSNLTQASLFLDKAMEGDKYPPGVIALKIEILLQDKYPPYDYLLELVELLSSKTIFRDNWRSAYHKGVIYTINGRYGDAVRYFKFSSRKAPWTLQRRVQIFWMENGYRKIFRGKIGKILSEREGRIYSHRIDGLRDAIFFEPISQKKRRILQPGLFVEFKVGFSPKGPLAFEVIPHTWKK